MMQNSTGDQPLALLFYCFRLRPVYNLQRLSTTLALKVPLNRKTGAVNVELTTKHIAFSDALKYYWTLA